MPCDNSDISIIADNGSFKKKDANGITLAANNMYPLDMKMTFDALNTPLTLEAKTAGAVVTFKASKDEAAKDIEYSTDGGTTWTSGNTGGDGVSVTLTNVGDKVMFRGTNDTYCVGAQYNNILCSADCYVYGNIMSLIDKDNFATNKELTATNTFLGLFKGNTYIYNHAIKTLELPATKLQVGCYNQMFYGCKALTTAPELPATTLTNSCYRQMFQHCTALQKAPKLPATSLPFHCYNQMFSDCTNLNEAWVKAAYTSQDEVCYNMFYGCAKNGDQLHTLEKNVSGWNGAGRDHRGNFTADGDWTD